MYISNKLRRLDVSAISHFYISRLSIYLTILESKNSCGGFQWHPLELCQNRSIKRHIFVRIGIWNHIFNQKNLLWLGTPTLTLKAVHSKAFNNMLQTLSFFMKLISSRHFFHLLDYLRIKEFIWRYSMVPYDP